MRLLLRAFIVCVCLSLVPAGCAPRTEEAPSPTPPAQPAPRKADSAERIDAALVSAARYLVKAQSPDGAWRSEVYGFFKDGPSLTPHVLSSLRLRQDDPEAQASFRKGVDYLGKMVGDDSRLDPDAALSFPVYTSAEASWVVVMEQRTREHLRAQAAWLAYLRRRQLGEALGWQPADREYGGWGYTIEVPRRPPAGQPKGDRESNLSATIYAIDALRSAKVPLSDPVYKKALIFVSRCQNVAADPRQRDKKFDDGGFFFRPGDAAKNKAGVAGTDKWGRQRYWSYGGTTADGLRALVQCGLRPDHPRVVAARRWLERNFSIEKNPGTFAPDRQIIRNATYYYYCRSLAHTLALLDIHEIATENGGKQWAALLAEELMARQNSDGSWRNRFTDTKEDDPLVSTPAAAEALAICRRMLAR